MPLLGKEEKPLKIKTKTLVGKGSKPRPIKDKAQFDKNWDAIFGQGTKTVKSESA